MGLANGVDRVIAALSPTWGAQRRAARLAIAASEKLAGNYSSSFSTRVDKSVNGRGQSADFTLELGFDRRRIVDRARVAERDNPVADALLTRSEEAVVGEDGFRLKCKASDPNWNATTEALWKNWCYRSADCRGVLSFGRICSTVFRSMLRDGDVGVALLSDLTLRIVESDEISAPEGSYFRPDLVDGVELDPRGKPAAFYVYDPSAASKVLWSDRRLVPYRTRIPAEFFVFMARRQRAGQTRGISAMTGVLWHLEQIDGSLEAETVAMRMAACFGVLIKKRGPLVGLGMQSDSGGSTRQNLHLEPGMFMRLEPNEEIEQVTPSHPGGNFESHIRFLLRFCGTAFGLPLELLINDFSQTNYSNARTALLQTWRVWRRYQADMKRFCSRIFEWWLVNMMQLGLIDPVPDALSYGWEAPGWQWLDPVAEIQGALAAIDAGLESKNSVVARMGGDMDDIINARSAEIKAFAAAGIPEVRSNVTRDPGLPGQSQTQPGSKSQPGSPGSL